jgi:hypothetical protein
MFILGTVVASVAATSFILTDGAKLVKEDDKLLARTVLVDPYTPTPQPVVKIKIELERGKTYKVCLKSRNPNEKPGGLGVSYGGAETMIDYNGAALRWRCGELVEVGQDINKVMFIMPYGETWKQFGRIDKVRRVVIVEET